MSTQSLNLCGVLSETTRIINAHSRHFLALSVLFLLPLSFSFVIYPSLMQPSSILSSYNQILLSFTAQDSEVPPIDKSDLLLPILYGLFVLLFSLFATASITYSTFHGFYGRPVKFISSLKSVLFSFFPLIATMIVAQLIMVLICFAFGGLTVLLYNGLVLFGVELDYENAFFLGFAILIMVLLVGVLIYFQVEWTLANVVVVVESQWGFSPLRRSSYLIKGMRSVAFSMTLFFGLLLGLISMLCSSLVPNAGGISEGWVSWAFAIQTVQTVAFAGFMTIIMLNSVAANAVLFMYCKALHGELALEIVEEFAQEYVSLPFDDEKVPHVVYVV